MRISTDPDRNQSSGEELSNTISHGAALVAALVGTPFIISNAVRSEDAWSVVGASIFSATIILLYLASALYHLLPAGKAKRIFRVIEHSAIFLLIAGTYTPFTLGVLRGVWGWTLFGIIWGIALIGVTLKVFVKGSHPVLSTILYLSMGWVIVIAIKPLLAGMPMEGFLWLLAGGLSYTAGVYFYVTDWRFHYGHFIWHLFVITGTVCHYFAVFRYAV
ncbi:MAG: hemolysin III family protein [Proteobacteria bacterium]|nr:hemolysin III family protein [Pseudomonadota bacterium]MBU1736781.1 hemolysin III family protein [Pseudomonadota bacterium]